MNLKVVLIAMTIGVANCLQMQARSTKNDRKILIAYFTMPETDGVDTSSGTHKELIDYAKKENESGARPARVSKIRDLDKYDVIFIGFPNWWYDMPMPVYTFFDEHDFSGKTIVPFCTHGGSRFSQAIKTIKELEKGAEVLDGYSVSRDNLAAAKEEVKRWLQKIGINE